MDFDIVFIVGPPRSGTTLTQSILASHSEVETLPETHFFEDLIPLLPPNTLNHNTPMSKGLVHESHKALERSGISLNNIPIIDKHFSVKLYFETILRDQINGSPNIVVEKTPAHALFIGEIRKLFPTSKIIANVRHPVESVGSMRSLRPISVYDDRVKYITSMQILAKYWNSNCHSILENMDQQMLLVRYEDLIENPVNAIRSMCKFLNINFEDEMLTNFAATSQTFINLEAEPWKKSNFNYSILDNRYKWRKCLSSGKIWIIEETTSSFLQEFHYARTLEPRPISKCYVILFEKIYERLILWDIESIVRRNIISFLEFMKTLYKRIMNKPVPENM